MYCHIRPKSFIYIPIYSQSRKQQNIPFWHNAGNFINSYPRRKTNGGGARLLILPNPVTIIKHCFGDLFFLLHNAIHTSIFQMYFLIYMYPQPVDRSGSNLTKLSQNSSPLSDFTTLPTRVIRFRLLSGSFSNVWMTS